MNENDRKLQEQFIKLYKSVDYDKKTIKDCCLKLGVTKSQFSTWLEDVEFESKFFALRKLFSYELEELITNKVFEMIKSKEGVDKKVFQAQAVAQRTALELLRKLNRERFGDKSEISIEHKGQIVPQINISLIQRDEMPVIEVKPEALDDKKPLSVSLRTPIAATISKD